MGKWESGLAVNPSCSISHYESHLCKEILGQDVVILNVDKWNQPKMGSLLDTSSHKFCCHSSIPEPLISPQHPNTSITGYNWNLEQCNNECIPWPTCKWPSSRQVQMTGRVEIFQKLFQDWSKFSTYVQSSHQRTSSCPPADWSIVSQEVGWQYHYHLDCWLMFPCQVAGNWDTDGRCDMAG